MVCLLAELAYGLLSPLTEFFSRSVAVGGRCSLRWHHPAGDTPCPIPPQPWGPLSDPQSSAWDRDVTLWLKTCPGWQISHWTFKE